MCPATGPDHDLAIGIAGDVLLSDYALTLIAYKARRLARLGSGGRFNSDGDADDAAQELTLRLLVQAPRYDPARAAPDTFANRVICSAARSIRRDRRRLRRAGECFACSLERSQRNAHGRSMTLRDVITPPDLSRRTATATAEDPSADVQRRDQGAAVRRAVAALPPRLRQVAERLSDGESVAAVARELGSSRRRAYDAIAQVRQRFAAAGLGDA